MLQDRTGKKKQHADGDSKNPRRRVQFIWCLFFWSNDSKQLSTSKGLVNGCFQVLSMMSSLQGASLEERFSCVFGSCAFEKVAEKWFWFLKSFFFVWKQSWRMRQKYLLCSRANIQNMWRGFSMGLESWSSTPAVIKMLKNMDGWNC